MKKFSISNKIRTLRKECDYILNKIIKKMLVILTILIANFAIVANVVQAVEADQVNIYTKGYFSRIIKKDGILVKTAHAVYEENGKEYPAYCLNREVQGVGDEYPNYEVANLGKITDEELWKVIINGYPYKTPEEIGAANEEEAYMATKQAIYCYIYGTKIEQYSGIGDAGNRVVNAISNIIENAKTTTENFADQIVEIGQTENWKVDSIDKNYISKQYEVTSKTNISSYKIHLENELPGSKICNLKNQEQNEFKAGEKFKILIPIEKLEKDGKFKVEVETQMETKPIFYGEAPSTHLQDYALTYFEYEDIGTEFTQNYETNDTQIIIEKQDDKTEEPLKGAKFQILNENKEIIKTAGTDENGKIYLKQLIPGTYYIKEIEAPEGYTLNGKTQQIEIEMNEQLTVKIGNSKITIIEETKEPEPEPEPPKEEKQEEPPEEPVIEVPKLPITGM